MDQYRLSIIIPIYNGASHIRNTLESVLASGIEKFTTEVLLIDDGSSDNTSQICNEFVNNNPRIFKYFFKQNGGLSSARNYGLRNASGQYVFFLDADDLLRPGSLGLFFEYYFDDKFDVIGFSSDTIDYVPNLLVEKGNKGTVLYEGSGLHYMSFRTPTFVWIYWYKRQFILDNSLSFTIMYPEDVMFNLSLFRLDPEVRITSQKVICYMNYQDGNQLTKQRDPNRIKEILKGYMTYFEELALSYSDYGITFNATSIAFNGQIIPFLSRCLSSTISTRLFASYGRKLKELFPLQLKSPTGMLSRVAGIILKSSNLFPLYRFFYKRIFLKFIYPWLSRA